MMDKTMSLFLAGLILFNLFSCTGKAPAQEENTSAPSAPEIVDSRDLQIRIQSEAGAEIVFRLNDSPAAKALYDQLPLTVSVENFSDNEKIFYPPQKLDTTDTPSAQGPAGTLAYYAPWGDVAIFYGECSASNGLYALGEAVSGVDLIEGLTGTITIEKIDPQPDDGVSAQASAATEKEEDEMPAIEITVGDQTFHAKLYDNPTARAFLEKLPMTVQMEELNGNEKYYHFSDRLPTDAEAPGQIRAGDLMLYGSDCLVLFYQTFSTTYRYTPLGRVDDALELAQALGSGSAEVTFRAN